MVRSQGLTISGLAAAGGVGVETVRFYQRLGLIEVPARGAGVRRYDVDDIARLRFVRAAAAAGFTLAEIARLLALDAVVDRGEVQTMAAARIAALDRDIAALSAARDSLARLADSCAAGPAGHCPILAAFEQP